MKRLMMILMLAVSMAPLAGCIWEPGGYHHHYDSGGYGGYGHHDHYN